MNAKDLTLNIAVNLGRLSRWAMEGNKKRVDQFLSETEDYIHQLENTPKKYQFISTFLSFKKKFQELKESSDIDDAWAEDVLTWANILTHRAKLA